MLLRPFLVGMIEIDARAGMTFLSPVTVNRVEPGFRSLKNDVISGRTVIAADVIRLQEELADEFRALLARIAAQPCLPYSQ